MRGNWQELRELDREKQKREGYEVQILYRGEEVLYREGDKSLIAERAHGNILYTYSLKQWQKPKGKKLTQEEYELVLKRICEYLSTDGVKVRLDDSLPPTWEEHLAEIKTEAEREGWEVIEEEDRIIVKKYPEDAGKA